MYTAAVESTTPQAIEEVGEAFNEAFNEFRSFEKTLEKIFSSSSSDGSADTAKSNESEMPSFLMARRTMEEIEAQIKVILAKKRPAGTPSPEKPNGSAKPEPGQTMTSTRISTF